MDWTREERIENEMHLRKDRGSLESSRGYCEAFVDGMMAIETNRFENDMTNDKPKHKMTHQEAIACFEKHMPYVVDAYKVVYFYVEAGILDIVEQRVLTCDHVDDRLMIIKRHGKIIYDETK